MGCTTTKSIKQQKNQETADQYHNDRQIPSEMKQTLEQVTSKTNIRDIYDFVKILGTGGFAQVKLAISKQDNQKYAVKVIEKTRLQDKLYLLLRELKILKSLDHPNIIKFHEIYEDSRFFYIVQEFCMGGELLQKILNLGSFSEKRTAYIMQKVFSAVLHMHQCGIVHRDLKPENILFVNKKPDSDLKIIDFGLSNKFEQKHKLRTMVGTPLYVSPQLLQGKYTEKCDIWSLGVIMYVMLSGSAPFQSEKQTKMFDQIQNKEVQFDDIIWRQISEDAMDLIKELLQKDENKRISLDNAMKHKWFTVQLQDSMKKSKYQTIQQQKEESRVLNKLKNFQGQGVLQKEIMHILVNQPTPEIKKLTQAFQQIDTDQTGLLKISELQSAMKQCDINIDNDELDQIFNLLSPEEIKGEKIIRYSEFLSATLDVRKVLTEEKMWSLFKYFDSSNTDSITVEDLREIMNRHGVNKSIQEIKSMINEVDENSDGVISYNEFKRILMDENVNEKIDLKQ